MARWKDRNPGSAISIGFTSFLLFVILPIIAALAIRSAYPGIESAILDRIDEWAIVLGGFIAVFAGSAAYWNRGETGRLFFSVMEVMSTLAWLLVILAGLTIPIKLQGVDLQVNMASVLSLVLIGVIMRTLHIGSEYKIYHPEVLRRKELMEDLYERGAFYPVDRELRAHVFSPPKRAPTSMIVQHKVAKKAKPKGVAGVQGKTKLKVTVRQPPTPEPEMTPKEEDKPDGEKVPQRDERFDEALREAIEKEAPLEEKAGMEKEEFYGLLEKAFSQEGKIFKIFGTIPDSEIGFHEDVVIKEDDSLDSIHQAFRDLGLSAGPSPSEIREDAKESSVGVVPSSGGYSLDALMMLERQDLLLLLLARDLNTFGTKEDLAKRLHKFEGKRNQ